MQSGQGYNTIADIFAQYRGVRVVVLGASGFIGRWVARMLCRCGADISLPVRDAGTAGAIFDRYEIEGDLIETDLGCDPDALETVYRRVRPAITFNLAGYGIDRTERDEETAFQVNEKLVRTLCRITASCRDRGWGRQAVVHAGSALEYGEIGGDLGEDSIPNPTTLYGRSKLAGTRALASCCDKLGVNGITARLFTVYGPG
ncbi:MAG TPA: NAD-dependent epimerase/dehydratase family protein, partial [Gammaproteobacteria bacterium]|nr:NAD-dependent epimerase/dehydratase family protein [Gammaproteobacteria bacterium]